MTVWARPSAMSAEQRELLQESREVRLAGAQAFSRGEAYEPYEDYIRLLFARCEGLGHVYDETTLRCQTCFRAAPSRVVLMFNRTPSHINAYSTVYGGRP